MSYAAELRETIAKILAPGKGILAADESTSTIANRFQKIGVENTEENRRAYRELLFTTPNWQEYISGVILFEETLDQSTKDGVSFVEVMNKAGVVPGIKVDKGLIPFGRPGETSTVGIDGLDKRCQEYYAKGARFAKWRGAYKITATLPSTAAINENARLLALYALCCQRNGLVPIVEPEVLQEGDHTIERSFEATKSVLVAVFNALNEYGVDLEAILLKPNMVVPGYSLPKAQPSEVAAWTVRLLQQVVPVSVPGVVFLSGGQTEEESTVHLNLMNQLKTKKPWVLTFSYGRALQSSAQAAWSGKPENVKAGQDAFLARAKANYEATLGTYSA